MPNLIPNSKETTFLQTTNMLFRQFFSYSQNLMYFASYISKTEKVKYVTDFFMDSVLKRLE